MTYYLKYRPQRISELDSVKVREQLKSLLKRGEIPHSFLFLGPKGAGKTSAARILAKAVNCAKNEKGLAEPCNNCEQCIAINRGQSFDVIEMDAASNRGIDDIRSLKENILLSPTSSRKKIYIIDEVHMLTTEAFNALLKTLEEPPDHVLFILATTDAHKIPETVRSRLVNIIFEKGTEKEIVGKLKRICQSEKVTAEEEALKTIAQFAGGSFRDAVKLLEQATINLDKLTAENISDFLSGSTLSEAEKLLQLISEGNAKKCVDEVERVVSQGASVKSLIDELLVKLHNQLLAKVGIGEDENEFTREELIELTELLTDARAQIAVNPISQLPLEIALIKWCKKDQELTEDIKSEVKKKEVSEPAEGEELIQTTSTDSSGFGESQWYKMLSAIKAKNASVEAFLRAAKPLNFDGENLTIGVYYRFHKEQLEAPNNRKILLETIQEVTDKAVHIKFVMTEKVDRADVPVEPLTETQDKDIIDAAKEIFGG